MTRTFIHVLTGDGKGKTTAALGLSLRAAGSGLKIFFGQFAKKGRFSEIRALERFADRITVEQFGLGNFIEGPPSPEDIQAAQRGLERIKAVLAGGEYDMLVLDEANVAVKLGLISVQALLEILVNKPDAVELVITGRHASPRIIEAADIVTEMKAVKHYYQNGVAARVGIEK